jgi:MoxR-like ATPase
MIQAVEWIKDARDRLSTILRGKDRVIKMALVTLIGRGHLLIEDIPGVGKTTLALGLARVTDCTFQRIQFTSDLLPSDILGVHIYNPDKKDFEFRPGPIFANIVLADEINRTNPKTQSALLEAMNERRVSIERSIYTLPEPFMVIATQNPIEYHGTFPLPESQLDRFMLHLRIGYPSYEDEKGAVVQMKDFEDLEGITPLVTKEQILKTQRLATEVHVDEDVVDYLMKIVWATRRHPEVRLGTSTRGAQHLLRAAKAHALVEGRDYTLPEDIKEVAPLVLGHRILLRSKSFIRDAEEIVQEILNKTEVPV